MATQNDDTGTLLISYMTLRKAIGVLAISLPAILIVGTCTIGGCKHIQASISHYYYTMMGDVFVGFLISTGIFLITYKGYERRDNVLSCVAGIAIICVALLPTSPNEDSGCVTRSLADLHWRTTLHYASAAVFYVILAYISLFLFTKSAGGMTPQKIKRNKVYRICGVMIIVAILLILIKDYVPALAGMKQYGLTFWLEWLANLAYGISWLIKGEFLLKD